MTIKIGTAGSRGDVQPYLALAVGLKRAGHAVQLATHANFAPLAAEHGIELLPIEGNPREMLDSPEGLAWLQGGANPVKFARGGMALMRPLVEKLVVSSTAALRGAELIVLSPLLAGAIAVAQQERVPAVVASLWPVIPTRHQPSPFFPPGMPRFPGVNWLSHALMEQGMWRPFKKQIDACGDALGLPRLPGRGPLHHHRVSGGLHLCGYSPSLLPAFADWNAQTHVTGYWFLDGPSGWQPPARLADFLASGRAPVYVGFGSMTDARPDELMALVLRALRQSGQRGVLLSGWLGVKDLALPDDVIMVDSVPHDWLFPRMAAVVHHGGAGTTAATLRAGVPNIVVPFFADQYFWGAQVARLGVGPTPVPRKTLSADALAAAITRAVTDETMQQRARGVGAQIRGEDGVGRAAQLIEAALGARAPTEAGRQSA